ncbi:MAG: hypothetical protein II054_00900, partial [Treponema sp.]|nr:hypothetical protein [Treponema sp.]
MSKLTLLSQISETPVPPEELLVGKRRLTAKEVYQLIQNRNTSSDPDWQNVWVCSEPGMFNPEQIV